MSPLVIQMHGLPGSGKSTIARQIAERSDAVVLDKDVIKAALLRAGIPEELAAPGAYEVHFAQADDLVALRRNVILDNPVFWPRVEESWHRVSERAGSPAILIECVCPDGDELARRLATRPALESQPRTPYRPRRAEPGYEPAGPRLVLDTTRPLDTLVGEALAYVQSRTSHLQPATPHHHDSR